jgi:hypothetical protein
VTASVDWRFVFFEDQEIHRPHKKGISLSRDEFDVLRSQEKKIMKLLWQ